MRLIEHKGLDLHDLWARKRAATQFSGFGGLRESGAVSIGCERATSSMGCERERHNGFCRLRAVERDLDDNNDIGHDLDRADTCGLLVSPCVNIGVHNGATCH